jgi:hypothetical protein
MAQRTLVQPFFLTALDEMLVSEVLKEEFPAIRFVDGSRWPSPEPVLVNSISNGSSRYVLLWPSDLMEKLPHVAHGDEFDGPQSGVVMQMMRSRQVGDGLLSGQLGVGFSDEHAWMVDWSRSVVNALRRLNSMKLKAAGKGVVTGAYIVGPDAARFLGSGGRFKHNLVDEYYEAVSLE